MLCLPGAVRAAGSSQVEIERHGALIEVLAEAHVTAPPALAFATVTDYESLPTFVPDLHSSRVVERSREGAIERLTLEQRGELRFLFFARALAVRLRVEQQAPISVVAHQLAPAASDSSTDLRSFDGSYTLRAAGAGTMLTYHASFEPGFALPPFVGSWFLRRTIRAQFQALVDEIERRAGAAGAAPR